MLARLRQLFLCQVSQESFRACVAARKLQREEGGVAAIEFAFILPILLLLWVGGVEVTSALSVDRRMNNLASAVGDLVSRDKRLTFAEVDQIFDIAPAAMYPYGSTGLSIRVSAVQIDKDKNATVAWSRAKGSKAAYTAGTSVNNFIAANLRVPESQIIMSEVYQSYRPGVGYVITGEINMEDRMFFVPRLDRVVKLCDNKGENCKPDRY